MRMHFDWIAFECRSKHHHRELSWWSIKCRLYLKCRTYIRLLITNHWILNWKCATPNCQIRCQNLFFLLGYFVSVSMPTTRTAAIFNQTIDLSTLFSYDGCCVFVILFLSLFKKRMKRKSHMWSASVKNTL